MAFEKVGLKGQSTLRHLPFRMPSDLSFQLLHHPQGVVIVHGGIAIQVAEREKVPVVVPYSMAKGESLLAVSADFEALPDRRVPPRM